MNILAMDTSSSACSVMLCAGDDEFFRVESGARQHSRHILLLIDDVLKQADLSLTDIALLAWNAGPGSFTGLRIASSVIQAMVLAVDMPVLALSATEIIAYTFARQRFLTQGIDEGRVLVALDARMEGVYWASFSCEQDRLVRTAADSLLSVDQVSSMQINATDYCLGDAWTATSLAHRDVCAINQAVSARDVMQLARTRSPSDGSRELSACEPFYIRDTEQWQKRKTRKSG